MKGKGNPGKGTRHDSDCPLHFPDFKTLDHEKHCPLYTSVIKSEHGDPLTYGDLNKLQGEVETLLTACTKRIGQLENEIQILVEWQDGQKKDKRGEKTAVETMPIAGKRGKGSSDKPSKKFKDSVGKDVKVSPGPGRPKSKIVKPAEQDIPVEVQPDMSVPPPRLPKSEAPARFWASIEPYCAEITQDDLKVLEEVMMQDDADYYKVPSLGKHYSVKWAAEDMQAERRDGAKISDKRRGTSTGSSSNSSFNEGMNLVKKASSEMNSEETSPFGPLTQRLVSALIEENIMTPIDDSSMADIPNRDSETIANMTPKQLAKQLNIGNTMQLEKRIKKELEEQGILDVDDKPEDNPDDEVLAELRKKQQELKAIGQHNLAVTKRLYKTAKEEMSRQDLRRKMATVDAEIMDGYRKIQASRAKKKTPTKKEKDAMVRSLKERESIAKQLHPTSW